MQAAQFAIPKHTRSRQDKNILATRWVAGEDAKALQSGVRFAAYPDESMSVVLSQWIGCQRVIFNAKVEEDHLFAAQRRLQLRDTPDEKVNTPLDRQYSQFKSSLTPWLSEVPSQILRNGSDRWWEAKQRQLKGLSKMPRRRHRNNFNSVVISSELFRFVEHADTRGVVRTHIELGSYANPVGVLPFIAHCAFDFPKQIVVRNTGKRWWVSFSYSRATPEGFIQRTDEELAYELNALGDDELKARTLGVDRNTKHNCVATSDGRFYALSAFQQTRLQRKAKGAKRLQKRFARCEKGSHNSRKVRHRLARKHEYRGNVARDFSHQTSHKLVNAGANGTGQAPLLISLENLKVANMTRRPKAKQDPQTGRWLKNGARAKAGLHKSILQSCWGSIDLQVRYKSQRTGSLMLKVPAPYTSQGCSQCGHIHPDNRNDNCFVCQRCGHADHADTNAGCNIAARAIAMVRDQKVVTKAKKSVAFRKKGPRTKNSGQELPGVPVEGIVSQDLAIASILQNPVNQEYLTAKLDAPTRAHCV